MLTSGSLHTVSIFPVTSLKLTGRWECLETGDICNKERPWGSQEGLLSQKIHEEPAAGVSIKKRAHLRLEDCGCQTPNRRGLSITDSTQ